MRPGYLRFFRSSIRTLFDTHTPLLTRALNVPSYGLVLYPSCLFPPALHGNRSGSVYIYMARSILCLPKKHDILILIRSHWARLV
jgi:hypothetical protein